MCIRDRNTSTPPKLYVNYVSHAGLEGWWQYETLSAGRAGTSYVDLFNGNLVHSHPDVAMSGSRMPVSVAHYYNSCLLSLIHISIFALVMAAS